MIRAISVQPYLGRLLCSWLSALLKLTALPLAISLAEASCFALGY